MAEHDQHRRLALGAGLAGVASFAAAGTARAQAPASTWDRIKSSGELRIGVVPGEPWFYKDLSTGAWGGIGAAAGDQVARDLNVKLVTVETTWANAVAGLQAGQYDAMFVLDATPQRALSIDFPVQPFFFYAQGALVRDGTTIKTWNDLDKPDVTIGVALGTAPERDMTSRIKQAKIERFPGLDPAILAFQAGKLTALCFYHPALVLMQQKTNQGTVVLPEPYRYSATFGRGTAGGGQNLAGLAGHCARLLLHDRRDAADVRDVPHNARHRPRKGSAGGARNVGRENLKSAPGRTLKRSAGAR